MKKILAIMAAACAMSAFADFTTQETFEGCTEGTPFELIPDYWTCEGDLEDLLTIEATPAGSYTAECGYPAANSTHDKALKIDGASKDKPLYYYSQAREEGGDPQPVDIGQGIYLDTMVNFTVTDEIDQQVENGSKLALFLYSAEDSDTTNLVFRAGYYSTTANAIIPTNYVMTGSVEAGKWYRLTVKAIKIGATEDYYGFVPYLDGQVLGYENEDAGVAGSLIDDLNPVAAKYYTKEKKSLLPCLFETGMYAGKIVSCGFVGTGLVDDLTFTDDAPDFARDATSITIRWGEGVASVTVNDEPVKANPFVMDLPAGATTITVTATAADGYVLDGWTDGEKTVKSGDTIEINAFQPALKVGDKSFKLKDIDAAVAEAISSGENLTLCQDISGEAITIEAGDGAITIDLAGHDFDAGEGAEMAFYVQSGSIIIINSTQKVGSISATNDDNLIIAADEGSIEICGGKMNGLLVANEITFFGGELLKAVIEEGAFPEDWLADDYVAVDGEEGYWLVKKAGGDDPWQDVEEGQIEGVTEENKAAVVATLETIKTALAGDEAAVGKWITTVYGNEKVPAATVAAAKNVAISVKYDLPLMTAEKPTIEIKQAVDDETAEPIEGFTFQIKDAGNPVSLAAAVDKIQSMVQFTADLEKAFDASEATDVTVGLSEDKKTATATFTKATAAGFMKVELK